MRYRALVLACWICVLVVGVFSALRLPGLLATSFTVPGTESARANDLLEQRFGEAPEGTFVVVFEVPQGSKALELELRHRLEAAARLVPTGQAGDLADGDGILYGEIGTQPGPREGEGATPTRFGARSQSQGAHARTSRVSLPSSTTSTPSSARTCGTPS